MTSPSSVNSPLAIVNESPPRQPHSNADSESFKELSHEFRSSLNTILMSVELLEDDDTDEEECQSYLEFIRTAAEEIDRRLAE
ncbi:histidine kinase dimerization/phospho-acceptor domain-containing protein [Baaleninema sp.]|uniref:histidine kinase dimerization/phospho-acceptor domain-containing protein n=1 Tax=Baaleninema sp. TaxID=3101197 RepID=UPI003D0150A7